MKRTILTTAVFISLLSSASAQRRGLWIAPQFSIGAGTLTSMGSNDDDADLAINFNVGADVYYMFTNNIGAGVGMAFGAYGAGWRSSFGSSDADYILGHANMDIPIFFRYTTGVRHGFFVQAGIINSFLLGAEQRVEIDGDEVFKIDGEEAKDNFSSVSIYPFVFLGANIACGNRVQLSVGPYFQYQANNNFSDSSPMEGHYFIFGAKIAAGIHTLRR